jgi:hypothetical protein
VDARSDLGTSRPDWTFWNGGAGRRRRRPAAGN